MKTTVEIGCGYALRSELGGVVTNAQTGKMLETLQPNKQVHMTAQEPEWDVPDDCQVTKVKGNFNYAPIGSADGGASALPAGAVKVDYLESSGSQYIKTGYYGNQNTGLSSVHQQVQAGNVRVAGTRDPSNLTGSVLMAYSRNSAAGTAYGYASWNSLDQTLKGWNERQTGTTNFENKRFSGSLLVGESFSKQPFPNGWDVEFSCPYELYLFAFNNGGVPFSGYSFKGKIFEFKISQGENVVRDYQPYVSRDGVPFMWDSITGRIHENAGTGAFRVGLSTEAQVRTLLNNLPDLTGAATPGELLIRLDESIATGEVQTLIETITTAKNWSFVEP